MDNNGKLYTFGDNPTGQLGTGNFDRCYSPQAMMLDINGRLEMDTISTAKVLPAQDDKTMLDTSISSSFVSKEVVFKLFKYSILLASLALNIVLFRKLRIRLRGKNIEGA